MDRETFKTALKLASDYGDTITLGGGEPTIHPQLWEFFGLALATFHHELGMVIVTNGSVKDTAIALAVLAKAGMLYASLSQDAYHDPIDPKVVEAFTKSKTSPTMYGEYRDSNDMRCISHPGLIINAGRAKKNGLGEREMCFCDDLVVEPNGQLWMCGCRERSFGTVSTPDSRHNALGWRARRS